MKLNRRQFGMALSLLSLRFGQSSQLAASCIGLRDFEAKTKWDDPLINYWIDSLSSKESGLRREARIAILLKHKQKYDSYIDKVLLTNENNEVLAARYYTHENKISTEYPPYLIFDGIDLNQEKLILSIQIKNQEKFDKYRYVITKSFIKASRLNGAQLPSKISSDLSDLQFHKGFISSPFYFKQKKEEDPYESHLNRAKILSLNAKGEFKIEFTLAHLDEDEDHFMRYFIVTDPVGRILGFYKRSFQDTNRKPIISALSSEERIKAGLTLDKVANINDCPYIMLFSEDKKYTLSKSIIYLR